MKRYLWAWTVAITTLPCVALFACSDDATKPPGSSGVPTLPDAGMPDGATGTTDGGSTTDASAADGDAGADGSIGDGGVDATDASDASVSDASEGGTDGGVDTTPRVAFYGRYATNAAGPIFAWPSGRIVARFSGTSATVKLATTAGFSNAGTYFDVVVDGTARATPLAMVAGTQDYEVAAGLPAGEHTVELYKRTEAAFGRVQFQGFTFPGGTMLAPPVAPTRRIEFVSDSQIMGYGIEGAGPNCPGGAPTVTHNARKSTMDLTATALSAELLATAHSGKGLGRNASATDPDTFDDIYARSLPEDATSTWSFATAPADVVVITIGGQDFDEPGPPPSAATFATRYDAFVGLIRTHNPSAVIVAVVGPQISDAYPTGYQVRTRMTAALQQVVTQRTTAGDAKVHYLALTEATTAQVTACHAHGGPALHAQMTAELVPFIRSKTGW